MRDNPREKKNISWILNISCGVSCIGHRRMFTKHDQEICSSLWVPSALSLAIIYFKMIKNIRWLQFKAFRLSAPFPERSRSAGLSTLELRIFRSLVERVEENFIPPCIAAKLHPNKGKRFASLNKNVNSKHKGLQGTVIYVVMNGWRRTDDHFEKDRNSWLLDAISFRHLQWFIDLKFQAKSR